MSDIHTDWIFADKYVSHDEKEEIRVMLKRLDEINSLRNDRIKDDVLTQQVLHTLIEMAK